MAPSFLLFIPLFPETEREGFLCENVVSFPLSEVNDLSGTGNLKEVVENSTFILNETYLLPFLLLYDFDHVFPKLCGECG